MEEREDTNNAERGKAIYQSAVDMLYFVHNPIVYAAWHGSQDRSRDVERD